MTLKRGNHGTSSAYERFYVYDEKPKTFILRDFSGGVSTKQASSHSICAMRNMLSDGGALFTADMPREEYMEGGFSEGEVRDHRYADGMWLFRKGRTLYARKQETITLVGHANMLSEEYGAIYDLGGCFFVIDGERVWRVGRDLSVSSVDQRIPICFTDVSRDGLLRTKNESPNPFTPYMDIVISQETSPYQTLPQDIAYDPNDVTIFYPNSEETLMAGKYTFDGTEIYFLGVNPMGCRIRLKLLPSDDATKLSFSSTSYLRAFLSSPNPFLTYRDVQGEPYFLTFSEDSILLIARTEDMFSCFSEDRITRIPTEETITALVAYSDGYLLFTENTVKKLSFVKNELLETVAVTETFKYDFGSDMPGSICSFDDKILFANSKGGIFCINKFGITERDASRKISENIEDGEDGFFSHTEEEYHQARGICAFGRYYLTVGAITYIWDYAAKLPAGTQSLADEESMVWTLSDRFSNMDFLYVLTGRLYVWDREKKTLCYLLGGHALEREAPCSFTIASSDLGTTERKIPVRVGLRYRSADSLRVKLVLDGVATAAEYHLPRHEQFSTAWIRPYSKSFEKVGVSVFSKGAVAAETVIFEYI